MKAINILNNIKEMREDGWIRYELSKNEMDVLMSFIPKLAALEAVAEAIDLKKINRLNRYMIDSVDYGDFTEECFMLESIAAALKAVNK